jgi:hypothetical protein
MPTLSSFVEIVILAYTKLSMSGVFTVFIFIPHKSLAATETSPWSKTSTPFKVFHGKIIS